MKNLFFIMMILFSLKGFSQKSQITPEMSALVDKNVALYAGDEYKEYRKLDREFAEKIPVETSFSCHKNDFKEWVTANLSKTHFKSVDEAVNLYDRLKAAHGKFDDKFSELDAEQDRVIKQYADREQFNEIFSKEFGERLDKATIAAK
ncbi:hypothetical protein MG290_04375 [Flavobacterium sp. CBA20B-1]|uniref:hypothetical protein n=1 Tax=unclassified Flavobacterium TaxID=196869 RepID=UPI0022252A08|nr:MULTISPECIES: hypothetical protein [unclassified Flavobacterium]WCM42926.1 hypothetical protein MG290_04375 [Flavobacterium sp. CBA20B-1]